MWSDELCDVAQAYSAQCVFLHNSNRFQQSPSFSYVGENIAITSGKANYTFLVQLWYDEVQYYNYNCNQCGDVCGHYT